MRDLLTDLSEAQEKLRRHAHCRPAIIRHADALARLQASMSVRPRVVLLGENNAGKSSLANLLLGDAIVPDDVIPNTRRPLVLRYAESAHLSGVTSHGRFDLTFDNLEQHCTSNLQSLEACIPNAKLTAFDLVDTPGLSMPEQPCAVELQATDLVLWCTRATQAWKESERRLWMSVPRRYHRDAILVATHSDLLRDEREMRRVHSRLATETAGYFRSIVPVCTSLESEDRVGPKRDNGAAALDDRIAESLSAIAQRRQAAGYRRSHRIMRKAMVLIASSAAGQVEAA